MKAYRTHSRSRSAGLTIASGVSALLLSLPVLQAQSPSQTEAEALKLEKFVVTGSMIPVAADTPAVPVTIVTSADIARTGLTSDLTDVLKKSQPYFFGRGNIGSDNANTRSGGTNGASTLSIRNRSTLILINGRRAALAPTAAVGGGNFVDVSMIPPAAVERVEVLSDGASAIYGTDAVAGVINIILKTNYSGAEIGGSYGWAPEASNWSSRSAYLTAGGSTDRSQVTVSAEWRRTDPLYQYERPWGVGQFRTPTYAGVITPDAVNFYYLNPALNAPPQNLDLPLATLVAQGIYSGPLTQDQVLRFYDLAEWSTMLLSTNRRSATVALQHRWTENITAFGDILATQSLTRSTLNAQPVSGNVAASNPFNPADILIQARNRFRAFPRIYNVDSLGLRAVFGLKGSIPHTSWSWELGTSLNRTSAAFRNENLIDTIAYNAAVANGTYNPFARRQAAGVIEGMLGTGSRDFRSWLHSFDFRVNGELFQLPGGPLQAGLGLESRMERISMVNDRNDRTGGWLQATPTNPFSSKQDVDAFFAELRVPVFGGGNARTGLKQLEVGVAARTENYSSTTDPLVPKFSLRWLPLNDEFVVRGTYSESFSAPTLFSLFGPQNSGFTNGLTLQRYNSDGTPMRDSNGNNVVTAQRQYRSRGGSNPNLVPSESRNWTAGFVWSPRAIKEFSLSVDWFNVDERDLVGTIPQGVLLQSVEQLGAASPYASRVRIAPSIAGESRFDDGAPVTTPGQITAGASDAVWMTNPSINIAGNWQAGADVRLDYTRQTDSWGRFTASVAATYIESYVVQNLPTSAPFDFSGGFGGSTFPRYRTYTQLDWNYRDWTFGFNHSFIPEVTDFLAPSPTDVESWQSLDLRVAYDFRASSNRLLRGLRLTAGVNNVFNEDPPFMLGEQDQSRDINTYDPLGRYFYVSVRYKF